MKISERIKSLGDGLIERTTVETEIDTQVNYIPMRKATKEEINRAFADAGLIVCALDPRIISEYDTTLGGNYQLWKTYMSNLYDEHGNLVAESTTCHREVPRTGVKFLEMYKSTRAPKNDISCVSLHIILAAGKMLRNEEGLMGLWENNEARFYIMGQEYGENIRIFPEKMTADSSSDILRRMKMFDRTNGCHGRPFALLLSLGQQDSSALSYFKANPGVLSDILIDVLDWVDCDIKLKHTVSKNVITNKVTEDRYDFIFNNQPKE